MLQEVFIEVVLELGNDLWVSHLDELLIPRQNSMFEEYHRISMSVEDMVFFFFRQAPVC